MTHYSHHSNGHAVQRLTSANERPHAVLNPATARRVREISPKTVPSARVLFSGPKGTGPKVAAELLGEQQQQPVVHIDLSRLVSKYIGETEKNLNRLFHRAEEGNWILFFDEADALFGKRSDVNDAHDRYSNLEVSYLLQRIEQYSGVVIFATNQRHKIDDSIVRRLCATEVHV